MIKGLIMNNKVSPEDEQVNADPNEEEKVGEESKVESVDSNSKEKRNSKDSGNENRIRVATKKERTISEKDDTQGETFKAQNGNRTQGNKESHGGGKPRRNTLAERPKKKVTEEENKIQLDLMKKEEELMKKIAYHHHDKANVVDSEESICIAPPPPQNRMSVVRLVICGVKGYKKCLYFCAALQFLTAAAVCVSVLAVLGLWPIEFAMEFRVESEWTFLKSKVFILVSAIWPLLIFVWFFFTVIFSTTKKVCFCCPQKTHWCLRGFHCCGVGEAGWKDWEHRMKVNEEVIDWIVPASCCRKQSPKEIAKCQNETTDDLVWDDGCFGHVYNMCLVFGNIFICTLAANIIMNFVTICFSTRLYSELRSRDGSPVEFNVTTYLIECCCCCRKCKPPFYKIRNDDITLE